ncbi:MAG: hypothetical protein Q8S73_14870 [Deltaproteobacteria bacterium]|nr:hypothetical protein [Myxococcales bacterium]MDP3215388.1 hypothetical protein [Deltaproteobacteria bacterium]
MQPATRWDEAQMAGGVVARNAAGIPAHPSVDERSRAEGAFHARVRRESSTVAPRPSASAGLR